MSGPTSYYLPDGDLIFPYDTQNRTYPPWIIVRRTRKPNRRRSFCRDEACYEIARYRQGGLRRYRTEIEAKDALRKYAESAGLRPAY